MGRHALSSDLCASQAVVEDDNGEPVTMLPATEYLLTPEHPMRVSTDKISVTDSGLPDASKFFATNREDAPDYREIAGRRRTRSPTPPPPRRVLVCAW